MGFLIEDLDVDRFRQVARPCTVTVQRLGACALGRMRALWVHSNACCLTLLLVWVVVGPVVVLL